jgi:hypothetical protein
MSLRHPVSAVCFLFIFLLTFNIHFSIPTANTSPFILPSMPGTTVTVTQGNNQGDHIAANGSEFAFDFIVGQKNFVITAAQGGTVIGVNDSSHIQCGGLNWEIAPKTTALQHCWAYANFVLIADDDGKTAALYMHLLPYSDQVQMPKVTIGEHINQGDPIGLAGTTGWSSGVHLHFQVESLPSSVAQQQDPSSGWWWTNSFPITFSNPEVLAKDVNGVPQTGQSFVVSNSSQQTPVPPTPVPPTPVPPTPVIAMLQVNPTNLIAHNSGFSQPPCHPNESSLECIIVLSSPSSNQQNINWSVSAVINGGVQCSAFFYTLKSGTISPGQQINVPVDFTCDPGTTGTITFSGAAKPVIVQWKIVV